MRDSKSGGQRDQGTGISLAGPASSAGYKDLAGTPEPLRQTDVGKDSSGLLNRTSALQKRGQACEVLASKTQNVATPFGGGMSNVDPGSAAMPSSANVKIV